MRYKKVTKYTQKKIKKILHVIKKVRNFALVLINKIVLQIFKSLEKMKKLVFMFVAMAAISFASCGNKTEQAPAQDTVDTAAVDTVAADTAAADTVK